jgi:predicted amidophosphoribosyltransferase
MALINCPDCNKQVSDQALACPNCARPFRVVQNFTITDRRTRKEEARTYNYVSWFLFASSILLFLVGMWMIAPILFIGAFICAIIYHVMR